MAERRSITIKDIARMAGVSHSTVSRALNNSPLVNDRTRRRIQRIEEERNFAFNASARSLSKRRTGVVAVIYMTDLDEFGSSLYASRLFLELRRQLEFHRLDAILLEAYNPQTGESHISRLIRQQKVDGFLLLHTGIRDEDYALLRESRLPVVQLHARGRTSLPETLDFYETDNRLGGALAAEHLIGKGCGPVLTVSVKPQRDSNREFLHRTEGFQEALRRRGRTREMPPVLLDDCSYKEAYRFVRSHTGELRGIEGYFFQADIMTFGALCAFKELGIGVPDQIRIIGYDDSSVCTMTDPELTTIRQPREELCRLACGRLFEQLNGRAQEGPLRVSLSPRLVERGSS